MRSFAWTLLLSACATTPRAVPVPVAPTTTPAAPAAGPRLEHLEARVGLSEPEFDAVVRAHLPELARCIAFAHWGKSGAERVTNPEKLDDRVQVELTKHYPDGFDDAPFRVKVEAVLSDKECVAATVRAWPWPKEQVAVLDTLESARGPAVSFRYRFRPDDAARAAAKAENVRSFEALCAGFQGAKPTDDLRARFDAVRGKLGGELKRTLEGVFVAVQHAAPIDRSVIVAASVREAAEYYDVGRRCRAFRGWLPLSTAELLESEGLPTTACSERVSELEALAGRGFALVAPSFSSARAKVMDEAGLILDLRQRSTPLAAPPALVKKLAAEQAAAQQRKRPIAWVRVPEDAAVSEVVDAALRWSVGFELRLLVARVDVPPKHAATAWPEVVTVLRARRAGNTLLDVAGALEGEDAFCPGVAAVGRRLGYGPPEESLVQLTRGLAEALRGCGCPHPFAELSWARMALALDDLTERIGWVPLNVTTDPKAPAVELRGRDEVQQLVKALGDAPVRVKLSAF